jgi:hypothetical protein
MTFVGIGVSAPRMGSEAAYFSIYIGKLDHVFLYTYIGKFVNKNEPYKSGTRAGQTSPAPDPSKGPVRTPGYPSPVVTGSPITVEAFPLPAPWNHELVMAPICASSMFTFRQILIIIRLMERGK